MLHFARVLSKLIMSEMFWASLGFSNRCSLSLLLIETNGMLTGSKEELKVEKNEEKVSLDKFLLLDSANRSIHIEGDGLESRLDKNLFMFPSKIGGCTFHLRSIRRRSFPRFSFDLPKLCTKRAMELKPFASKLSSYWPHRDLFVEKWGVDAAPVV